MNPRPCLLCHSVPKQYNFCLALPRIACNTVVLLENRSPWTSGIFLSMSLTSSQDAWEMTCGNPLAVAAEKNPSIKLHGMRKHVKDRFRFLGYGCGSQSPVNAKHSTTELYPPALFIGCILRRVLTELFRETSNSLRSSDKPHLINVSDNAVGSKSIYYSRWLCDTRLSKFTLPYLIEPWN